MLGALEGGREEVEERGEAAERGEVAERGGDRYLFLYIWGLSVSKSCKQLLYIPSMLLRLLVELFCGLLELLA